MQVSVAHILKTIVQPERFSSSWYNSINYVKNEIDKLKSNKKKLDDLVINEYEKKILAIANNDIKKSGKVAKKSDLDKVINAFGNRVTNLADMNRVNNFLEKQIMDSNMPESSKNHALNIINGGK